MTMQARMRDREEWYHPDRDIAHNFHLWLRAALERTDTLKNVSEGQRVQLVETAARLARLVGSCTVGSQNAELLSRELGSLEPQAMGIIGREFLCHLMAMYREVRLDVLPKVRVDE